MPRRAYKVGLVQNNKINYSYRVFPTKQEALDYSAIVFRGIVVQVDEVDLYPNSRFLNNRALSIRCANAS